MAIRKPPRLYKPDDLGDPRTVAQREAAKRPLTKTKAQREAARAALRARRAAS